MIPKEENHGHSTSLILAACRAQERRSTRRVTFFFYLPKRTAQSAQHRVGCAMIWRAHPQWFTMLTTMMAQVAELLSSFPTPTGFLAGPAFAPGPPGAALERIRPLCWASLRAPQATCN